MRFIGPQFLIVWANRKDGARFTFVSCSTCLRTLVIQEVFVIWIKKTPWIYASVCLCTHIHAHIFMLLVFYPSNSYKHIFTVIQVYVCVYALLKYRAWVRNGLSPDYCVLCVIEYQVLEAKLDLLPNWIQLDLNPYSTINQSLTLGNLSDDSKFQLSYASSQ